MPQPIVDRRRCRKYLAGNKLRRSKADAECSGISEAWHPVNKSPCAAVAKSKP
jgi:hypothetical protein